MGDSRVQVDGKSSSTPTPAFKPKGSSFLEQRYQDQVEAETDSFTEEKQLSSSGQPNPTPPLDPPPFEHSFGRVSVRPVQAKLRIGQPGDKYEQEADRVADQVMRMPEPRSPAAAITRPVRFPVMQRMCSECEEELQRQPMGEEEEEVLQTKPLVSRISPLIQRMGELTEEDEENLQTKSLTRQFSPLIQRMDEPTEEEEEEEEQTIRTKENPGQATSMTSTLEARLNTSKGSGQPLPEPTRSFMESRFGQDFSEVRVHADGDAAQLNRELGAQAFTHGQDVYFGAGKYGLHSNAGKRLLAHELTHVVQQTGCVQQHTNQQSEETGNSSNPIEQNLLGQSKIAITNPSTPSIQRTEASDLIDRYTRYLDLKEDELGAELLRQAQRGNYRIVDQVLNELGSTNRDDVSYEIMRQSSDTVLQQFVQSPDGRQMLDRLYDELSAGSFSEEERLQANRIINAKESQIAPSERPQSLDEIKIFPFRLPGITVLNDAPIMAERRGRGRIWVRMPVRVLGTERFRNETRTLPTEVFLSGVELPENEIIGVRMYDLGGELHVRPALYLVQLANETNTQVLQSMAEAAAIGLTVGSGALVAGATRGSMAVRALVRLGISAERAANVVLWADRAAFAIGLITTAIRDHRGWIIEHFGDAGRQFLDYVDLTHRMVAIYGMARFVLEMGGLLNSFRSASRNWRRASAEAERELSSTQRQTVQDIDRHTDEFLDNANQIERSSSRAPSETTTTPSSRSSAASSESPPSPRTTSSSTGAALRQMIGEEQYTQYRQAIEALQQQHRQLAQIPTDDLVALRIYTSGEFGRINLALRQGDPEQLAQLQVFLDRARSGLRQLPRYQGTVHASRSMTDDMLRPYQVGEVVTERSFISTSRPGTSAASREGNVAFTYNSRTGRDISLISVTPSEGEVLFAPGTRFRVLSVQRVGGARIIHLEEVP